MKNNQELKKLYVPWKKSIHPFIQNNTNESTHIKLMKEHRNFFSGHKINDKIIVPAASHILMFIAQANQQEYKNQKGIRIQNINMYKQVSIDDINVLICKGEREKMIIESDDNDKIEYANCDSINIIHTELGERSIDDINNIITSGNEKNVEALYEKIKGMGADFGIDYRLVSELYTKSDISVAKINTKVIDSYNKSSQYLSINVIDSALQVLGFSTIDEAGICIPFHFEEIQLAKVSSQSENLLVYLKIKSIQKDSVTGDIEIIEGNSNRIIAKFKGVISKKIQPEETMPNIIHEIKWKNLKDNYVKEEKKKTIILLKEENEIFHSNLTDNQSIYRIDDYNKYLNDEKSRLVIISDGSEEMIFKILEILKETISRNINQEILIFRNENDIEDSGIKGLIKTYMLENIDKNIKYIEYVNISSLNINIDKCSTVIEKELKLDIEGRIKVPRVYEMEIGSEHIPYINNYSTYIITGGQGGIGLEIAVLLVNKGAKKIKLLSRSNENELTKIRLDNLRTKVDIEVVSCDISKYEDVLNLKEKITMENSTVGGIFHAAGILDDKIIYNQTRKSFENVYLAKVQGAKNIKEVFKDFEFLIFFSSVSATFGSIGQANYAAANATLDKLAEKWISEGLNILSIQWGAWSEAGMAYEKNAVWRAEESGFGSINNSLGRRTINTLLSMRKTGVVFATFIDRTKINSNYYFYPQIKDYEKKEDTEINNLKLKYETLQNISEEKSITKQNEKDTLVDRVLDDILKDMLPGTVNEDESLFDNGLDSLGGVMLTQSLNKQLNISLSNTFPINYSTKKEMKEKILELVEINETIQKPVNIPKEINEDYQYIQENNSVTMDKEKTIIVEKVLDDILKDMLPGTVNEDESLFDNGLDSLGGVMLTQSLNKQLNISLSNTFPINYSTKREMKKKIMDLIEINDVKVHEHIDEGKVDGNGASEVEKQYAKNNEYIAVIGSACRLPGKVDTVDELWRMLINKTDCVTEIPIDRFDIKHLYDSNNIPGKIYTNKGAFIENVNNFDYKFFNISLEEAIEMDPQQRHLLEVTYQALHNSGYNIEMIKNMNMGVFIGQMNYDWSHMKTESLGNPYFATGSSPSIMANRISYTLGLKGPSIAVDTACSSSLVALDLAIEKIRNNKCNTAVVGGVNLILHERSYIGACAANMLSRKGKCATFDEEADGYCRGEGVGAVILKKLSDAEKDGDKILAVIRGAAVNQDGKSASLTTPNGKAQEEVINMALEDADLKGKDIDYVECHGTGTILGDPIEVEALKNTLNIDRVKPVTLGSIKTNIGHLEGAAGITSLIKTIEVVNRGKAPANVHLNKINKNIDLNEFNVKISNDTVNLKNEKNMIEPLRGAVSSFGFGGTNACVIIEEYKYNKRRKSEEK